MRRNLETSDLGFGENFLETFLDNNNIICKSMLFIKVCLLSLVTK